MGDGGARARDDGAVAEVEGIAEGGSGPVARGCAGVEGDGGVDRREWRNPVPAQADGVGDLCGASVIALRVADPAGQDVRVAEARGAVDICSEFAWGVGVSRVNDRIGRCRRGAGFVAAESGVVVGRALAGGTVERGLARVRGARPGVLRGTVAAATGLERVVVLSALAVSVAEGTDIPFIDVHVAGGVLNTLFSMMVPDATLVALSRTATGAQELPKELLVTIVPGAPSTLTPAFVPPKMSVVTGACTGRGDVDGTVGAGDGAADDRSAERDVGRRRNRRSARWARWRRRSVDVGVGAAEWRIAVHRDVIGIVNREGRFLARGRLGETVHGDAYDIDVRGAADLERVGVRGPTGDRRMGITLNRDALVGDRCRRGARGRDVGLADVLASPDQHASPVRSPPPRPAGSRRRISLRAGTRRGTAPVHVIRRRTARAGMRRPRRQDCR